MKTLIYNANLYTGNGFAEAAIIENGLFTHVGSYDELSAIAAGASRLDLGGKTAVPGFNDSHMHLLFAGQALQNIDLRACRSFDDMAAAISAHRAANPNISILCGEGWNQDLLAEHRAPDRYELDFMCPDLPLILTRICGHQLIANSAAITAAGVTESTLQPVNGCFSVDAGGRPLGDFSEDAMALINRLKAAPRFEDVVAALEGSVKMVNSFGVTSVSTMDINSDSLPLVIPAYDSYCSGSPTLRVTHQCNFSSPAEFEGFVLAGHTAGSGTPYNKIGSLKLFADGSLGARTALLRNDYADAPGNRGVVGINQDTLSEFVRLAEKYRFPVTVHAIGDKAIENVLDSYRLNAAAGNPLRHGVIHCQITDAPLASRFAAEHVPAMVQPVFIDYDSTIVYDRVGPSLASTSYAFASILHSGAHLALGSDWPVETPNPIKNIHCAVTRTRYSGGEPYNISEALTVKEAIDCYTGGSAYTTFDEGVKGRIAPGYYADMAVLSSNIFTSRPEDIIGIEVVATMVGGRMVFER